MIIRRLGRRCWVVLVTTMGCLLVLVGVFGPKRNLRRRLIAGYGEHVSWFNGESLVTSATGNVPAISCPVGKYRPTATSDNNFQRLVGFRSEGCTDCPRGRYGATTGLTSQSCSAECPLGRYRDRTGATSEDDCFMCPPGVYGSRRGLTTQVCSGFCPSGRYSNVWGLTTSTDCIACPEGYRGWQCDWEIIPQHFDGVHPHHHDLDTDPSFKLRSSSVLYQDADPFPNHPKPVDIQFPFQMPLVNQRENNV